MSLHERFRDRFGRAAAFLVRAPGRVNLIGEHIDYCGLSVLPMAIQREVRIACAPRDDRRVSVFSTLAGTRPVSFEARVRIEPGRPGTWDNYVRAAVQALVTDESRGWCGLDALVDSDLPPAAGLSSSSALVVASALALLAANGRASCVDVPGGTSRSGSIVDRLDLAARMAEAERYVGTAGGGMDQAACLLGRDGHALLVDFDPLAATPIAIPPGWKFVVAHSGEAAAKAGRARIAYNQRTRATAAAVAEVADRLGSPALSYSDLLVNHSSERLLEIASRPPPVRHLARFRHVVGESARVSAAVRALRVADLVSFGHEMRASHHSLAQDYEVSTAALDRLVEIATRTGAAGARLTGAGLGGSMVALCDADAAERVRAALTAASVLPGSAGAGALAPFVARPARGASVEFL